jgi:hypothetical protein
MDKWEFYPIKVLSIAPLIMVTLPTVSSFSFRDVVVGPRHPPTLVVASLDLIDLSREWSFSSLTSISCGWPLGRMAPSANAGAHNFLVLYHLHAQEMGGRTDAGMARAADPSPLWPGSVAPSSTWVLLTFCTWTLLIASFWRCHPHIKDRGSSRMKSGPSPLILRDAPL